MHMFPVTCGNDHYFLLYLEIKICRYRDTGLTYKCVPVRMCACIATNFIVKGTFFFFPAEQIWHANSISADFHITKINSS